MAESSTNRAGKVISACNECRRKRTKCDGELPCSRCASRQGLVCVYEPHLKQTKEVMQAELSRIRGEWQSMGAVLELLKTHGQPEIILEQLRSGKPLESITSPRYGEAASGASSSSPPVTRVSSLSPKFDPRAKPSAQGGEKLESSGSETVRRLYLENRHRLPEHEQQGSGDFPSAGWTAVTENNSLVDHLLTLYFCWEYPTFASLSKEHFILDFCSGRPGFCSSLLVNAILALGARSSDLIEARKNATDPDSAGEHFFEEAKRLLGEEEVPTLPMIQALGLMSLRQASCGNDLSSFCYARQSLRMALDIDLHRKQPASRATHDTNFSLAESEVRTATFWGCFNLEQAWSLCIGRASQVVPGEIEIDKPQEIEQIEHEDWRPYNDSGEISRDYHQPNNVRSVYRALSTLSEIINRGAYQLYSVSDQPESHKLLSTYHELLEWYDALPDQLRLGVNFTPTVLFTHMYYHFAILILFRPFRDLNITGSTTSPRGICSEASQNLFVLVKSYRDLYTLRRIPSFVPFMTLTANLADLVDLTLGPSEVEGKSVELASLSYLEEMRSSHHFAQRALHIMNYFAELWGVDLGDNTSLTRNRLQGTEMSNHPANDFAGTHTFFLPAAHSSPQIRPKSLQLRNFSASEPTVLLFPQQGRQVGNVFDKSFPSRESREDPMEE